MKVADIMTREVVTIHNSAPVAEVAKLMQQRNIYAVIVLPSYELDAYGIVTLEDVVGKVIAFGRNPKRLRVFEIMTKPCIVLNPDLGVEYAARLLTDNHLHSAPVIQSTLLGILSITDILKRSSALEKPQELELTEKVLQLTANARRICQENGPGSKACADAWAMVDSLEAEVAHQRTEPLEKTSFESFREEFPEAFRDQEYDTWCSG
jgi:CBS domain-containing protein